MPSGKQGFSEMGNSKCTLCIVKPEMEIWLLIVCNAKKKTTHKTSLVLKVLLTKEQWPTTTFLTMTLTHEMLEQAKDTLLLGEKVGFNIH